MDLHAAQALVAEHGPDRVTQALEPYLTEARQARIEAVLDGRMASVHVGVECPSDPHNAAAVVRTCEALGALSMHVIGAEARALHARATTQGAFHWVQTYHHEALGDFLVQMRAQGVAVYGACMDGSLLVERVPVDEPLCLLLGNEQRGLSTSARQACAELYRVPMVGMSESLNLSVCAAVSLYEIMRRKRLDGQAGDLDDAARARLRACYYAGSVDARLIQGLFGFAVDPEPSREGSRVEATEPSRLGAAGSPSEGADVR